MNTMKKFLKVLLTLCMILTFNPMTTFAADTAVTREKEAKIGEIAYPT